MWEQIQGDGCLNRAGKPTWPDCCHSSCGRAKSGEVSAVAGCAFRCNFLWPSVEFRKWVTAVCPENSAAQDSDLQWKSGGQGRDQFPFQSQYQGPAWLLQPSCWPELLNLPRNIVIQSKCCYLETVPRSVTWSPELPELRENRYSGWRDTKPSLHLPSLGCISFLRLWQNAWGN